MAGSLLFLHQAPFFVRPSLNLRYIQSDDPRSIFSIYIGRIILKCARFYPVLTKNIKSKFTFNIFDLKNKFIVVMIQKIGKINNTAVVFNKCFHDRLCTFQCFCINFIPKTIEILCNLYFFYKFFYELQFLYNIFHQTKLYFKS